MSWLYLIAAGLLEVIGVIGIKRTAEKNNIVNNIILFGGFISSFSLLLQAMETIPLSTAYAVWTAIGTVGSAIMGIMFYKESKNWLRMVCLLGIIFCVAALKFLE